MDVNKLFERLSYGELSNLSISDEGGGIIIVPKQPAILAYANEALTRLYSKFMLREDSFPLRIFDHVTRYHLIKRYALTTPNPILGDHLYIEDSPHNPFLDDVIKVTLVTNLSGFIYPLNDRSDYRSLYTPSPKSLQIPRPIQDVVLGVIYQANHPILINTTDEIDLPETLEGALTAYIAYQVYSNMNGQENAAKAVEHMARYEMICQNTIDQDLVGSSISETNTKFYERGWV